MITKFSIFEANLDQVKDYITTRNLPKKEVDVKSLEKDTTFIQKTIDSKKKEIDDLMIKINKTPSLELDALIQTKLKNLKEDLKNLKIKLKSVK